MNIRHRSGIAVLGLVLTAGGIAVAHQALASGAPAASDRVVSKLLPDAVTMPTEDRFVPVTPCRIVDTRAGTGTGGTAFSNLQTRTYYIGGTFGFSPQGGKAGGCGIPVGASALTANLKAVNPTHPGYIRAWPNGQTEPTATMLTYNVTEGTGVTVAINASTAYSLKIRNYHGPTDLTIDITGYYIKPLAALVRADGTTYDGTNRAVNSDRLGVGQYWVQFDRDITYCQANVTAYNVAVFARVDTFVDPVNTRVRVNLYNSDGVVTDGWFYIIMSC